MTAPGRRVRRRPPEVGVAWLRSGRARRPRACVRLSPCWRMACASW